MEVQMNGVTYKTGRLDAFQQLHVARRLFPVLPMLIDTLLKTDLSTLSAGEVIILAAGPMGQAIALMPQEDADFIVRACLSVCERVEAGRAAPMMTNGRLMYDTLQLSELIRLTVETIRENLGNFLPARATQT